MPGDSLLDDAMPGAPMREDATPIDTPIDLASGRTAATVDTVIRARRTVKVFRSPTIRPSSPPASWRRSTSR